MAAAAQNKTRNIVITIVVILVLLTAGVVSFLLTQKNRAITQNPAGTIGNTAGNINNGGYFAELDGRVYFANSYDSNTLYAMDVSEGRMEKISSSIVQNLLAAGDYLYYFQTGTSGTTGLGGVRTPNSYNRCLLDGTKAVEIVRETVVTAQLVGNTLFLLGINDNGGYLFRIGTDKSDRTDLTDFILNPACAVGNTIYYCDTVAGHALYALNTNTNSTSEIIAEDMWNPVVDGSYVYYMDTDNNYQLRRYSLTDNTIEILTTDRVDAFNVGHGFIYYQTAGKEYKLMGMALDGSGKFLVAEGVYSDISLTSRCVYFHDFSDKTVTYHAYLGSSSYEEFYGAKNSAAENKYVKTPEPKKDSEE